MKGTATPPAAIAEKLLFRKGMPAALDSERLVLGSILLDDSFFDAYGSRLSALEFSTTQNRTIWFDNCRSSKRREKRRSRHGRKLPAG